ncbi:MAG: guanylate kinase [Chloroflexota bacterium]|nr:guanylate kinase [Chloroflexota bacterium]
MFEQTQDHDTTSEPLLVVLSGPSGVGKDTVLQRMRELGLPMHYAITATTRPQRPGEVDGFHYEFLTNEEFLERKARDGFLEHANVYGYWYGSPKQPIREALARGQDVVLKIDVQGARSVREQVPEALFLFLAPPSVEWLREHLRERKTEDAEKLAAREQAAIGELAAADEFDRVIVNRDNDVDGVVQEIVDVISRARESRRLVRL